MINKSMLIVHIFNASAYRKRPDVNHIFYTGVKPLVLCL